jgi:hypothetical protein
MRNTYTYGILEAARQVIREMPELSKKFFETDTESGTCYCTVGAIRKVLHIPSSDIKFLVLPTVRAAQDALAHSLPQYDKNLSHFQQITRYNDDVMTTKEDIEKLFTDAMAYEAKCQSYSE